VWAWEVLIRRAKNSNVPSQENKFSRGGPRGGGMAPLDRNEW